jgi:dTDP-4-amino-4,6-dideoxygalactose transaminase
MKVPLLDLKLQYATLKQQLNEALIHCAESQSFILGPEVEKLEHNLETYLGCRYALGITSGTDALLIALMALDMKPGDEVIVPTFSFFATAGVVSRLQAVPVFCDIDPITFNLDPACVEKIITPKTKAIIPVHLYGQSAEMDGLMTLAKRHSIAIVEDGAQAIGAQYKDGRKAGTIGDIGCYSFFPSKNLGCFGDGGLVVTNNEDLAKKLRILRVHGSEPKYYHKVVGGNFRLDAIQAVVLNIKLPHLDAWSQKRRVNAELYTRLFKNVGLSEQEGVLAYSEKNKVLLPAAVYRQTGVRNYHIYNQYVIRIQQRDALKAYLSDKNIGSEIYYPVPFHRQECFAYLHAKDTQFPESNRAAQECLALPIFPELTDDQITYVVESIGEFFKKR